MAIGGVILMIMTKLDIVSNAEIQRTGLYALRKTLGITGLIRFLEQFDQGGSGDYTAEKYQKEEPELTDEEIRKLFLFYYRALNRSRAACLISTARSMLIL